jgi:hypothetical protein
MDEFRNPPEKAGPAGGKDQETGDESSATGIFSKPPVPSNPAGDDLLTSLLRQASSPAGPAASEAATMPPSPGPFAKPAERPKSAAPGEATRLLQAMKPAPASKPDLASVFKQISVEKIPAAGEIPGERAQPPGGPSSAGEFTQAFRNLSAKSSGAAPSTAPPAQKSDPSAPGEFTRLFQSAQTPAETPPPRAMAPPAAPLRDSPDSLTQLFSRSSAPAGPASAPAGAPESDAPFSLTPLQSEGTPQSRGGFTQLLRALEKEPVADPKPADVAPPLSSSAPPSGPAGGFTQLLETLSAQGSRAPEAPPPMGPPPAQPMTPTPVSTSSGPGEYTRVISASAVRESYGTAPAAANPQPAAASPGAMPPVMPQIPLRPPAIPAAVPHAAAPAPQMHAGMPAMPAFSFPPAPAPPAAAPPAAPAGGLQKYLPLILLVNVFLLLAIILILIFVLRHR